MFGLGSKGKMEIQLNKFNFHPGETVEGTVSLKLKKPLEGNELSITIVGEEKISQRGVDGRRTTRRQKIFDFKQPLDGQKEYTAGEQPLVYPFRIVIPANVLEQQKAPEGTLGTVMQAAKFLSGSRKNISWYLYANLDVPKSVDVRKKVQINVA